MNDTALMRDILQMLNCIDCNYQEWISVGMVCKDLGLAEHEWEDWSRKDAGRFRHGECLRKWSSFSNANSSITIGTIMDICSAHGVQVLDNEIIDWDAPLPDVGSSPSSVQRYERKKQEDDDNIPQVIRPEYISNEIIEAPPAEWEKVAELEKYLSALFVEGDWLSVCTSSSFEKEGKWFPGQSSSISLELVKRNIEQAKRRNDIGGVFGDYNANAGAWIRINPCKGQGNKDVMAFRHALVEADNMEPEKQLAIIRALNLPCATIVHSGGKSIHAIVKVDAKDEKEYRERVDFLFSVCRKNGLDLDTQNRNPSRYTRMPGYIRAKGKQFLIDTNSGAANWDAWIEHIDETSDDLPDVVPTASYQGNIPESAEVLIQNVLSRGEKLMISGPSKAGKTFLLMELAIAVSNGDPWLGLETVKSNVLYLNMELKPETFAKRIDWIYRERYGASKQWSSNLDVWHLRGYNTPLEKLVPKIKKRCKAKDYSIVIVDPLYKVFQGDENSAAEVAKMTNLFDALIKDNHTAVIYCHHHSKGSQSSKRAEDRASGSGVFARDADAILDFMQEEMPMEQFLEYKEKEYIRKLTELLDAHSPMWRHQFDYQEIQSAVVLKRAAEEVRANEAVSILEMHNARWENASLWAVSSVLRNFKPLPVTKVWFFCPLHEVVSEIKLTYESVKMKAADEVLYVPNDQPPQVMQKQYKKRGRKTVEDLSVQDFTLAYETMSATMPVVPVSEMTKQMKCNAKTLERFIDRKLSKNFYIKANSICKI